MRDCTSRVNDTTDGCQSCGAAPGHLCGEDSGDPDVFATVFSIDDQHSNLLTTGLQEHQVWLVAQRLADESGATVYVYERGKQPVAVEPEEA